VDVGHAVFDNAADFLEALVRTHGSDCVSLHEEIGFCEQFEGLEGGARGTEDTLATLDEAFFVSYERADFDNVTGDVVLEDFEGLKEEEKGTSEKHDNKRHSNNVSTNLRSRHASGK
jgi:hypothetical protein